MPLDTDLKGCVPAIASDSTVGPHLGDSSCGAHCLGQMLLPKVSLSEPTEAI